MRLLAALLTALLATASLFAADAPPSADPIAHVDAVFAKYAKPDSPGCAVGIAREGRTLLERGYGMASLEYDVPIAANTMFEAGSVSKQFTAAGKLSLDDAVRKYTAAREARLRSAGTKSPLWKAAEPPISNNCRLRRLSKRRLVGALRRPSAGSGSIRKRESRFPSRPP